MKTGTLKLSGELFCLNDIVSAKNAFSDFAIIRVQENGGYYILTFSECRYSIDETIKEFDNYVISLSAQYMKL